MSILQKLISRHLHHRQNTPFGPALEQAMEKLDDDERDVIERIVLSGQDRLYVATELGMRPDELTDLLHRALRNLQNLLDMDSQE